jgi:hypothetical protein
VVEERAIIRRVAFDFPNHNRHRGRKRRRGSDAIHKHNDDIDNESEEEEEEDGADDAADDAAMNGAARDFPWEEDEQTDNNDEGGLDTIHHQNDEDSDAGKRSSDDGSSSGDEREDDDGDDGGENGVANDDEVNKALAQPEFWQQPLVVGDIADPPAAVAEGLLLDVTDRGSDGRRAGGEASAAAAGDNALALPDLPELSRLMAAEREDMPLALQQQQPVDQPPPMMMNAVGGAFAGGVGDTNDTPIHHYHRHADTRPSLHRRYPRTPPRKRKFDVEGRVSGDDMRPLLPENHHLLFHGPFLLGGQQQQQQHQQQQQEPNRPEQAPLFPILDSRRHHPPQQLQQQPHGEAQHLLQAQLQYVQPTMVGIEPDHLAQPQPHQHQHQPLQPLEQGVLQERQRTFQEYFQQQQQQPAPPHPQYILPGPPPNIHDEPHLPRPSPRHGTAMGAPVQPRLQPRQNPPHPHLVPQGRDAQHQAPTPEQQQQQQQQQQHQQQERQLHQEQQQPQQPMSLARQKWNFVIAEREKVRDTLRKAEEDFSRAEAALEEARGISRTVQEAVQKICRDWYPFLIKEDRAWYEEYAALQAYQKHHGGSTVVPRTAELTKKKKGPAGAGRSPRRASRQQPKRPSAMEDDAYEGSDDNDGDDNGDDSQHDPIHMNNTHDRNTDSDMVNTASGLNKLSRWVGLQRKLHRKGQLEEYKVHALNMIQFDFDPTETKWTQQYNALVDFFKANGHSKVPYNYGDGNGENGAAVETMSGDPSNSSLGAWIKRQQYQYKRFKDGKSSEMTLERIKLLEAVNMVWHRRDKSWMDRYKELQDYKEKHGHINVDPTVDPSLAEWVRDQRSRYFKASRRVGKNGRAPTREDDGFESQRGRPDQEVAAASSSSSNELTKQQAQLIEEIGLDTLVDKREGKWQKHIDQLLSFRSVHGHCLVPNQYPKNQALATWCKRQRQSYKLHLQGKASPLTQGRIDQLKEIGFEFDVTPERRKMVQLSKSWEEQLAEVCTFQRENGHVDVPIATELGQWWKIQRTAFQEYLTKHSERLSGSSIPPNNGITSNLSQDQFQKLKAIIIPSNEDAINNPNTNHKQNVPDMSWEEWFGELLAHRIHAKTYRIPDSCVGLSRWVEQQRSEYAKYVGGVPSMLNLERIVKLQSVKFPFNRKMRTGGATRKGTVTKSWEEMYSELLRYHLEHDTFEISPHAHPDLFRWIQTQRDLYIKYKNDDKATRGMSSLISHRLSKLERVGFPFQAEGPATIVERDPMTILNQFPVQTASPKPILLPPQLQHHNPAHLPGPVQHGPFLPHLFFPNRPPSPTETLWMDPTFASIAAARPMPEEEDEEI